MDRREKAVLNKDKAIRLNEAWGLRAVQARYSDDGHWHATLARFPAALFDADGYVLFATEDEFRAAPMSIGKHISVPKPGISAMPGCVSMVDSASFDKHDTEADRYAIAADIEGTKTERLMSANWWSCTEVAPWGIAIRLISKSSAFSVSPTAFVPPLNRHEPSGFVTVSDQPRLDPDEDDKPYLIMARSVP